MAMRAPLLEVGSSLWWLDRLSRRLALQQQAIQRYDDYYRGRHRLAFASSKFRDAFGFLFSAFGVNWCPLVVDAVDERLDVEGFRLGTDPQGTADKDAWRIWQANDLDAESQLAHLEALIKGESYALVWNDPDDAENPAITIEDASEMTVERAGGDRRIIQAALKLWQEDRRQYAILYLPERIEKWQRPLSEAQAAAPPAPAIAPIMPGGVQTMRTTPTEVMTQIGSGEAPKSDGGWQHWEPDNEPWPIPNPLGEVPIVCLTNRRRLVDAPPIFGTAAGVYGAGSELVDVVPIQDAINKLVADMIVASEYGAFRQRWATGIDIPIGEDGNPIETFNAAVNRLWIAKPPSETPDIEPKFGEFGQTDLTYFVKAIEMLVQHMASITRTPPHYLLNTGVMPSGESIISAESGLVAKATRKQRHFGEGWEGVIRLAFKVLNDPRADVTDSETIWRDPRYRTEAQHVDALLKLKVLGIPDEQLWQDAGYTPQQVARFKEMRAALGQEIGPPLPTGFNPFESARAITTRSLRAGQEPVAQPDVPPGPGGAY